MRGVVGRGLLGPRLLLRGPWLLLGLLEVRRAGAALVVRSGLGGPLLLLPRKYHRPLPGSKTPGVETVGGPVNCTRNTWPLPRLR